MSDHEQPGHGRPTPADPWASLADELGIDPTEPAKADGGLDRSRAEREVPGRRLGQPSCVERDARGIAHDRPFAAGVVEHERVRAPGEQGERPVAIVASADRGLRRRLEDSTEVVRERHDPARMRRAARHASTERPSQLGLDGTPGLALGRARRDADAADLLRLGQDRPPGPVAVSGRSGDEGREGGSRRPEPYRVERSDGRRRGSGHGLDDRSGARNPPVHFAARDPIPHTPPHTPTKE